MYLAEVEIVGLLAGWAGGDLYMWSVDVDTHSSVGYCLVCKKTQVRIPQDLEIFWSIFALTLAKPQTRFPPVQK